MACYEIGFQIKPNEVVCKSQWALDVKIITN